MVNNNAFGACVLNDNLVCCLRNGLYYTKVPLYVSLEIVHFTAKVLFFESLCGVLSFEIRSDVVFNALLNL